MKLIMESWKRYSKEANKDCGYLYLSEDNKVRFYDALCSLTESEEKRNTFLENWEKSADLVLERGELNEGVMDLVSQAASVLSTLGKKSWSTVVSVTSKVSSFIERFKEEHPNIYKGLKAAIIVVVSIAAVYLLADIAGMSNITSAMESLAQFEWPNTTISDLIHDIGGQPTVDALRNLRDLLSGQISEYLGEMMSSDNEIISNLAEKIADLMPGNIGYQADVHHVESFFGKP